MGAATAVKNNRRFHELDLLRFIAAFVVIMAHYTHYGMKGGYLSFDFPDLGRVFQYGYFALEFLFLVSGFVILMTVQTRNWAGFISSRAARLYPTYWVCLTLTALAFAVANDHRFPISLPKYLANLTMFQTRFGFEHLDGVYWTLEIELVFYAWVLLICLVRQIHNADKILGIWLAASLVIHLFGGITFTKLDFLLLPKWSSYFIAGGAFYLTYQRGRSLYLSCLIGISYLTTIALAVNGSRPGNAYINFVGDSLLFVAFAWLISDKRRPIEKPWMVTLGVITYPLYLIHQDIGYLMLSELDGVIPRYLALLLVVTIMVLASYVLAIQIEKRLTPPFRSAVNRLLSMISGSERKQPARSVQPVQDSARAA
jgi:peptidoglycan/LPS O-acetylase OafA/YrhL